ncbi:DUF1534 domain-containing protein [Pseudomonas congelans]|nr:DUF1534 domain-containing protein [Pseudomonas congelans]
MPTRSMGTMVSPEHLSFLTLQRGNALCDALRHRFSLHQGLESVQNGVLWVLHASACSQHQNNFSGSSFSAAICSRRARIWSPQ